MRTGAAYIRVSTEEQAEYSPDSQIKKILEYAAGHSIRLPEEFIFLDEGISGRYAEKRPAFMRMISAAKRRPRPFDVILVWKFSRFARNRQDSILYKSMLRKECGIDVVSITEQLSDDPTAILVEALLEAMDEYYSINLAQEVRRGMNEKFSRGGVVSIPPFGYRMGDTCFEPDEEKAPLVRMIYTSFLNGASFRQIAEMLNRMGVRSNRGNLMESRTVEYILRNPVYLGKQRRSLDGPDREDRFLQRPGVAVVDGEHTAIVPPDTFAAVQTRLRDIRKIHPRMISSPQNGEFMLRGLVRCGSCGATLTRAGGGKALQCHRYTKGLCGQSHYITLSALNRAVLEQLAQDWDGEGLTIAPQERPAPHPSSEIQTLLLGERRRLERAREAYEGGIDSLEEYRQRKEEIRRQILQLKQTLSIPQPPHERPPKRLQLTMGEMIAKLGTPELEECAKNTFLRAFISKIVFHRKEGTFQIFYFL